MYSHQIPEPEYPENETQRTISTQKIEPARFPIPSDDWFEDDCEERDLRPLPDVTIRGFLNSVFGR